ncbi:DUF917 family protein [Glaciibacter superstes]|uniref:S-methyl thiohydantoin desulfurase domain-containing protein n=1 Tax=Glaciibacter superstes TaxID=501023 RepID=UPI0003B65981|nr:DUF917 family protein [Glaciibacter superstes]
MVRTLQYEQLPMLGRGFSLLGSGGGGTTTMLELALADASLWPMQLYGLEELDPALPCLGAAFVGSTLLLNERLPGDAPFDPLIAAAERWLGISVPVVCSLEGGGLNGLTPFTLAGTRMMVDADLTGRAVPGLDQMSLHVDRVPGVIATCDTGAGGVMLLQTDRPADLERIVRAAVIQAGGACGTVFAGFTVGDLAEHAILGGTARALELGTTFDTMASEPLSQLSAALGGRVLGEGRITAATSHPRDPHVSSVEIAGVGGEVHRIVSRSESLAFMTDGRVEASAPTIIVTLDSISRDILEVTAFTIGRHVSVIELPAPHWWSRSAERMRHVVPAAYGLDELEFPG